jgi:CheY-like chemotaxis protein
MEKGRAPADTILVVDDESGMREVLMLSLEIGGYRCIAAADGREALAAFDYGQDQIGAVITDLNMPEMDGIRLLRELRARAAGLPVVVSSGCISDEDRNTLESLGATAILAKPYTATQLLRCVESIIPAECGTPV